MFDAKKAQQLCQRLTAFQLSYIWEKLGKKGGPSDGQMTKGEALCFWTFDFLSGTGMLDQDRLRLWCDTFYSHVYWFGVEHLTAWVAVRKPFKIGFLDRQIAVCDAFDKFLNLTDGSLTQVIEWLRPCETISYDLVQIFQHYDDRLTLGGDHVLMSLPRRDNGNEPRCMDASGGPSEALVKAAKDMDKAVIGYSVAQIIQVCNELEIKTPSAVSGQKHAKPAPVPQDIPDPGLKAAVPDKPFNPD